jgi:uncharacterized membrane protein
MRKIEPGASTKIESHFIRHRITGRLMVWLFAAGMFMGGISDIMRIEYNVKIFEHLGYPIYLLTILGVAKVCGGLALVLPVPPRLREWAYAGFVFELCGATVSHATMGDRADLVPPVLFLLLCIAAYRWSHKISQLNAS